MAANRRQYLYLEASHLEYIRGGSVVFLWGHEMKPSGVSTVTLLGSTSTQIDMVDTTAVR